MSVTPRMSPSMRSSQGCEASAIPSQSLPCLRFTCQLTPFNASKGVPESHLPKDIKSQVDEPLSHVNTLVSISQSPQLLDKQVNIFMHDRLLLSKPFG